MREVWKPITVVQMFAYDGRYKYEVSNLGNVRVAGYYGHKHDYHEPKLLHPRIMPRDGVAVIRLQEFCKSECFQVHHLVAQAFLKQPEGANFVEHIDGDKSNNRVDNLVWRCNPAKEKKGPPRRYRAVRQYTREGEFVEEYRCGADAIRAMGKTQSGAISRCCRREPGHTTYAGFMWRYVDDDELFQSGKSR